MDITPQTVLFHNPERIWRQYLKGVVVEPGVALNETAAALFTQVNGERTLEQICTELLNEFDTDAETCYQDAVEVVTDLLEQGILLAR
jgi:coenzyme PQQ synthesis protein D (PqqD)